MGAENIMQQKGHDVTDGVEGKGKIIFYCQGKVMNRKNGAKLDSDYRAVNQESDRQSVPPHQPGSYVKRQNGKNKRRDRAEKIE